MIVKKNRNVRNLVNENAANSIFGGLETKSGTSSEILGEIIQDLSLEHCTVNNDANVGKTAFTDVSTVSSQSWNNEFEVEVTKKVQNKLEKLDRIIRGQEHSNEYDSDEIEEWNRIFPGVSIFGSKRRSRTIPNEYDNSDTDTEVPLKQSGLFTHSGLSKKPRITKRKAGLKPRSIEIGECLKVTSLSPSAFNKRKPSSKSLANTQLSEFSEDDSFLYNKLPAIASHMAMTNGEAKHQQYRSDKIHNNLILPPIITQYRSMSAIQGKPDKNVSKLERPYYANVPESDLKKDLIKFFDRIVFSKM